MPEKFQISKMDIWKETYDLKYLLKKEKVYFRELLGMRMN